VPDLPRLVLGRGRVGLLVTLDVFVPFFSVTRILALVALDVFVSFLSMTRVLALVTLDVFVPFLPVTRILGGLERRRIHGLRGLGVPGVGGVGVAPATGEREQGNEKEGKQRDKGSVSHHYSPLGEWRVNFGDGIRMCIPVFTLAT